MRWLIPPRLLIGLGALMIAANWLFPIHHLIGPPWTLGGIALMALGFAMALAIARRFKRVDTEINTFKTPRKLQTDGLFALTRNPIYLGMLLFLSGLAVLLGSAVVWFGPLIFFLAANFWYIPHEEEKAAEHFGGPYLDYKKKVRRWL